MPSTYTLAGAHVGHMNTSQRSFDVSGDGEFGQCLSTEGLGTLSGSCPGVQQFQLVAEGVRWIKETKIVLQIQDMHVQYVRSTHKHTRTHTHTRARARAHTQFLFPFHFI